MIPDLLLPRAEFGMERENRKEAGALCFATSLPCLFATGLRAGRDLREHIVHPPAYRYNVKTLSVSFTAIHSASRTPPGTQQVYYRYLLSDEPMNLCVYPVLEAVLSAVQHPQWNNA